MRAFGSASCAFSRRAAHVSATATISKRLGPSSAYAGTWPRSEMKPYPTTPPRSGRRGVPASSVIVLRAEVRDNLLAHHPAEGVLQLHELNEEVMLGVE